MAKYLYKLTDEDGKTHGGMQWGEGIKHEIPKPYSKNPCLCTADVIHAYENPLVAVLMNPLHADYINPILWKATGWVVKRNGPLKCGCFSLKTIERVELPIISVNQKVRIAIYCALELCKEKQFSTWAKNWLNSTDRTANTAAACVGYAVCAANAAAACVGYAVDAANAVYAANAAVYAANAAVYAAYTVAEAYAVSAKNNANFKPIKIIHRSMKEES